jgi:hypothetical protein
MKRKTVLFVLLAVILLSTLLLFQVSFAQEPEPDPLFVFPYEDGETFTAESADQPILLAWAWLAMTRGQLRMYLNHAYETYVMSGPEGIVLEISAEEAEGYWGLFTPESPDFFGIDCPMPRAWWVFWSYPVGTLPPGEYTLVWNQVFDQPVNDGFHVCSFEGQPISPTPSLFRGETVATTTIIVPPAE